MAGRPTRPLSAAASTGAEVSAGDESIGVTSEAAPPDDFIPAAANGTVIDPDHDPDADTEATLQMGGAGDAHGQLGLSKGGADDADGQLAKIDVAA